MPEQLLIIDLSRRTFEKRAIPGEILEKFLGGRGLGAYYLYTSLRAGVDPLGPENVLIFSGGPVQGSNLYYSSRSVLSTKSPLTGIYLYSVASGSFGHQIRRCGYYSIIIKGRSGTPVYLAQALQFALNSRGGCHHGYGLPAKSALELESPVKVEGKGSLVKNAAIDRILYDSAVLCTFTSRVIGLENIRQAVNAIEGRGYSAEDLKKIGLRILTLERLFNVREGITRQDDYLPGRIMQDPLPDGPNKGSTVPMDALLDEGYRALGWDPASGAPAKETLAELGLDDLALASLKAL